MRLQHISISRQPERDEATRHYYGQVLGLQEKIPPDSLHHLNLIWYQLEGDQELHLFVEADIDSESGRHFCIVVDDIHALREKLEATDYAVWDVEDIPGRPRFFARDPSNNIIEFASIEADYQKAQTE